MTNQTRISASTIRIINEQFPFLKDERLKDKIDHLARDYLRIKDDNAWNELITPDFRKCSGLA